MDAMDDDNVPSEIVKGCPPALQKSEAVKILLYGKEEVLRQLVGQQYSVEHLEIVPASEVVEMGDVPVASVRKKKGFSLVVGIKLIRKERVDVFILAGDSGAILVNGQVLVGRLPGAECVPSAPLIPTEDGGVTLLLGSGVSAGAKAAHLTQFTEMSSLYTKKTPGTEKPRVVILSVGVEEGKGDTLVKEIYPLLKTASGVNSTDSIEAREVSHGRADVCVVEAFTGDMVLRVTEGTTSTFQHIIKRAAMSSSRSKIGAALLKSALKEVLQSLDASRYDGAPTLGLHGLVVKVHDNAKAAEVCNAVLQCEIFKRQHVLQSVAEAMNVRKG